MENNTTLVESNIAQISICGPVRRVDKTRTQGDYTLAIQLHDPSAAMIVHFKLADITYKTLAYYTLSFFALGSNLPWRCIAERYFHDNFGNRGE